MTDGFSDLPFAAGSVFGLRSFRTTADHHLTGCTGSGSYYSWSPGTNEATCNKWSWPRTLLEDAAFMESYMSTHQVAGPDCTCGFYAYYEGCNDYAQFGTDSWTGEVGWHTLTGVVEGFGVVTVGSRGFRAAKGRIVALVRPTAPTTFDVDKVLANYPDVPVYGSEEEMLLSHPLTTPEDVGINPDDHPVRSAGRTFAPTIGGGWVNLGGGVQYAPLATWTLHTSSGVSVNNIPAGATVQYDPARMEYVIIDAGGNAIMTITDAFLASAAPGTVVNVPSQPNGGWQPMGYVSDPEPKLSVVERRKRARELAAERRQNSRLSNLGGIERRKRKP